MSHVNQLLWPDATVVADLARMRAGAPLVHCITNIVAANLTANVLLAIGAAPAMVNAPEEAAMFSGIAGALLINLGTVTEATAEAMRAAARGADAAGTPWVLDPVAVGGLPLRDRVAAELLQHHPAIIRGNGSEILALAGAATGGRGPESTAGSDQAVDAARALAVRTGAVVAVSGAVDYITDGDSVVPVGGGHVLMTKVTGIGCALGATMAAFAAAVPDRLRAAVSASAMYGAAGERAARDARLPGGFAVAFLDQLFAIGSDER
jgi:hydroxyethylthiazole kinase